MSITVRFPSMLRQKTGAELVMDESISDVAALVAALERRIPGLAKDLADPIFNIAVNDEMMLHGAQTRTLKDGDIVEFVPTIAGG